MRGFKKEDNSEKPKKEIKEGVKEEKHKINIREIKDKILKNKKKLIIILTIVVVLIVAFIIANLTIMKVFNYNSANKNFKNANYEKAIKLYQKLDGYKDSNEKIIDAYFEYGKQLIQDGKYDEALISFQNALGKETDEYISYTQALKNIEEKNYDTSINNLEKLSGFENADEELKKAYYLKAEKLLEEEKFESAKEYYAKAIDYENVQEKINICNFLIAEKYYTDGNLVSSKELYASLPSDLEYKGIKVSDRLDTLNKYDAFVKLSGTWKGTNGYYEVKHIYKRDGSWDSWYNSYTAEFPIKCVINSDGSVKITGTASFYSFTNYSTLNSAVKDKLVSVPVNVTVNAGESIPKQLVSDYPALVASSGEVGYVSITYTGSEFKLNFTLNDADYSQSFSNKYTSSITFNSK